MRIPTDTAARPAAPAAGGARTARGRRGGAPRRIRLVVDVLPDGQLRFSTPHARGWAAVARGPHQAWTAIRTALIETQIAGHAAWRGQRYDHDALTLADDPTEPRQRPLAHRGPVSRHGVGFGRAAIVRPDQAHPSDWTPNPDGSWTSPRGRTWRDPDRIASLVQKRAALGLPTNFTDWSRSA